MFLFLDCHHVRFHEAAPRITHIRLLFFFIVNRSWNPKPISQKVLNFLEMSTNNVYQTLSNISLVLKAITISQNHNTSLNYWDDWDFESSIFRHSVLTISKYLECFDGFPNIEALVDSEKKQSPNMSNSRSCFVKPWLEFNNRHDF